MAAKHLTLFGEVASGHEVKQRKVGKCCEFRNSWKDTALWPRVEGVDLPELPTTWLEYHEGLDMFCKLCTLPRSGIPMWTKEPRVLSIMNPLLIT